MGLAVSELHGSMSQPVSTPIAKPSGDDLLTARQVEKIFGGTRALDKAELTVRRGEIHALLGANGAGKSTLIKILAGVHDADGGDIRIGGLPLAEGRRLISFVHQDLGLIEPMSVRENMAMGYGYPRRWGRLIDWKAVDAQAGRALDFLDSPLEMGEVVIEDGADLGIGAILLPGVRVGRGAQVGAGAVVSRDVEPYTVVAGVPAVLLRERPE